jgi:hypothetical protein
MLEMWKYGRKSYPVESFELDPGRKWMLGDIKQ